MNIQSFIREYIDTIPLNQSATLSDFLCDFSMYARNNLTNADAEDFVKKYQISTWDFISYYETYCLMNFGSVENYQGEKGITPYKSLACFIENILYHFSDVNDKEDGEIPAKEAQRIFKRCAKQLTKQKVIDIFNQNYNNYCF